MAIYVVPNHRLRPAVVKELLLIDAPLPGPATTTLKPRDDGGFDAVASGNVVAHLTAEDAAELPELTWLADAGLVPQVAGEGGVDKLLLEFPPSGFWVPRNVPPVEPWVLLGAGEPVALELSADAEPGLVLCEIAFDDAGEVVVLLNGEVAGELPAGEHLTPTLRRLEERGLTAVAYGSVEVREHGRTLTVSAAPLEAGFGEGGLPTISPLPPITIEDIRPADADAPAPAEAPADLDDPDTAFFASVDAKAAALAADTEPESRESESAVRHRSRGLLVGLGATVAALALTAAGALVIGSTSDRDQDSASAYMETVTSEQSADGSTETETPTSPTENTTSPKRPSETPKPDDRDQDDAGSSDGAGSSGGAGGAAGSGAGAQAPARQAPAPVQQAPAPAPAQQAPAQQAPVRQAPAPAPAPAPAAPAAPAPAPAPAPQNDPHPFEYSIGGLKVRSNAPLDRPLYEVEQ